MNRRAIDKRVGLFIKLCVFFMPPTRRACVKTSGVPRKFFISFSPGFNRVSRGYLTYQYHLCKQVGLRFGEVPVDGLTHPLTQVVLTTPATIQKPLKRFEYQKAT